MPIKLEEILETGSLNGFFDRVLTEYVGANTKYYEESKQIVVKKSDAEYTYPIIEKLLNITSIERLSNPDAILGDLGDKLGSEEVLISHLLGSAQHTIGKGIAEYIELAAKDCIHGTPPDLKTFYLISAFSDHEAYRTSSRTPYYPVDELARRFIKAPPRPITHKDPKSYLYFKFGSLGSTMGRELRQQQLVILNIYIEMLLRKAEHSDSYTFWTGFDEAGIPYVQFYVTDPEKQAVLKRIVNYPGKVKNGEDYINAIKEDGTLMDGFVDSEGVEDPQGVVNLYRLCIEIENIKGFFKVIRPEFIRACNISIQNYTENFILLYYKWLIARGIMSSLNSDVIKSVQSSLGPWRPLTSMKTILDKCITELSNLILIVAHHKIEPSAKFEEANQIVELVHEIRPDVYEKVIMDTLTKIHSSRLKSQSKEQMSMLLASTLWAVEQQSQQSSHLNAARLFRTLFDTLKSFKDSYFKQQATSNPRFWWAFGDFMSSSLALATSGQINSDAMEVLWEMALYTQRYFKLKTIGRWTGITYLKFTDIPIEDRALAIQQMKAQIDSTNWTGPINRSPILTAGTNLFEFANIIANLTCRTRRRQVSTVTGKEYRP